MTNPIDEKKLTEIEERAGKATAGPWEWVGRDLEASITFPVRNNNCGAVIEIPTESCGGYDCCGGHSPIFAEDKEDQDFIAHSRQDIDDLCKAVRERDAEIKKLKEHLQLHIEMREGK